MTTIVPQNIRALDVPNPQTFAQPAVLMVEVPITTNLAANDIVQIGVLHAACRVVSATVEGVNIPAATLLTVGTLDGERWNSNDANRAMVEEIISGAPGNAPRDATMTSIFALTKSPDHRGLGVKVSAAITAAAAAAVRFRITYIAE